ncbi:MAG: class II aldolase/adducin family protein [Spirochaetaceae bacterium]
MNYKEEKIETAQIMERLYNNHLTTCSGGNISLRVNEDTILITPSALDKGNLKSETIAVVKLSGENLTPHLKTSIETEMHLDIYRARPDVKAIVHAHPIHASLFTATDKKIRTDLLAESRFMLGEPEFAAYSLMGTKELALNVSRAFSDIKTRVVLMENHGVITIGESLFQAYDRIEVLEASARMTYMGELLGGVKGISKERLIAIDEML